MSAMLGRAGAWHLGFPCGRTHRAMRKSGRMREKEFVRRLGEALGVPEELLDDDHWAPRRYEIWGDWALSEEGRQQGREYPAEQPGGDQIDPAADTEGGKAEEDCRCHEQHER